MFKSNRKHQHCQVSLGTPGIKVYVGLPPYSLDVNQGSVFLQTRIKVVSLVIIPKVSLEVLRDKADQP